MASTARRTAAWAVPVPTSVETRRRHPDAMARRQRLGRMWSMQACVAGRGGCSSAAHSARRRRRAASPRLLGLTRGGGPRLPVRAPLSRMERGIGWAALTHRQATVWRLLHVGPPVVPLHPHHGGVGVNRCSAPTAGYIRVQLDDAAEVGRQRPRVHDDVVAGPHRPSPLYTIAGDGNVVQFDPFSGGGGALACHEHQGSVDGLMGRATMVRDEDEVTP